MPLPRLGLAPMLVAGLLTGPTAQADPAAFWQGLMARCGQRLEGRLIDPQAQDADWARQRLLIRIGPCSDGEIRIPVQLGADASRTWVLTRNAAGLRLKHEHRHADGSEDRISQYGGDSHGPGTPTRQDFPADAVTAALIPAAAGNVWSLSLLDGGGLGYALRRAGRRFEAEFQPAP